LVERLADAIAEAHRLGVVHRAPDRDDEAWQERRQRLGRWDGPPP